MRVVNLQHLCPHVNMTFGRTEGHDIWQDKGNRGERTRSGKFDGVYVYVKVLSDQ